MIKLAVSGCCGKMGRRIASLAWANKQFKVTAALESSSCPQAGKTLEAVLGIEGLNLQIEVNPEKINQADVLIEFSDPAATIEHLKLAKKYKKPIVIGTTGLDEQQIREIKQAAAKIAVVFSPNMSVGVNLVFQLVKQAAEKLAGSYQADIIEAHHLHKKDAPSGTARRLAELIQHAGRKQKQPVPIQSIREDEIVGDHQVRFDSPEDTIIIKHSAKTRDIFAHGSLEAAKFAVKQKPGLYDMQDVINSR